MKHILKQYRDLIEEREEIQNRISRINRALDRLNREGIVKDAVKGGLGNMQTYHIEGFPTSKEDELKHNLNKQRSILAVRESDISDLTNEVEQWLNGLDDSRIRRLITKRLIEGKPWNTVAAEMGDKYTEDSCRMLFNRFVKEVDKEE